MYNIAMPFAIKKEVPQLNGHLYVIILNTYYKENIVIIMP